MSQHKNIKQVKVNFFFFNKKSEVQFILPYSKFIPPNWYCNVFGRVTFSVIGTTTSCLVTSIAETAVINLVKISIWQKKKYTNTVNIVPRYQLRKVVFQGLLYGLYLQYYIILHVHTRPL